MGVRKDGFNLYDGISLVEFAALSFAQGSAARQDKRPVHAKTAGFLSARTKRASFRQTTETDQSLIELQPTPCTAVDAPWNEDWAVWKPCKDFLGQDVWEGEPDFSLHHSGLSTGREEELCSWGEAQLARHGKPFLAGTATPTIADFRYIVQFSDSVYNTEPTSKLGAEMQGRVKALIATLPAFKKWAEVTMVEVLKGARTPGLMW